MTDTERLDWLEKMADEGMAPAILYDDNGHWAMVFDGIASISASEEPSDWSGSYGVEAHQWKPTAREAIDAGIAEFRGETHSERSSDASR